MRKFMPVVFMALIALVTALGIGSAMPAQVAQAGGGPTNVPWLRVYQIDTRAVSTNPAGVGFLLAFDTAGAGVAESIEFCETPPGGCGKFPAGGYPLGGEQDWTPNIQAGWIWMEARAFRRVDARVFITQDSHRETISAEPIELQPSREASNEVWPFIDQAPTRLGESLKLRIERDLGLPVIRSEVCIINNTVWTCQYEDNRNWGLLLNGAGTQYLGLVLSHPNIVREGPQGKLVSFPNGASIRVRYTMVDGSSVTYQSQPLFFFP